MGILRKAAVGSLIVGLGALAVAKNKKSLNKLRKNLSTVAKKALKTPAAKNARRVMAKAKKSR